MCLNASVPDAASAEAMFDPKDLHFGRTVVPVPNRNKKTRKDKLMFEYAEHCFIGDAITLTLADGQKVAASDHKFKLANQLNLTYGQINGLAGDFYGTYDPISNGKDEKEQSVRFVRAFNTLAKESSRQPKEAMGILAVLQREVDEVNKALANHQDPSVIYAKLPDVSARLEFLTVTRKGVPRYSDLARINWDHFGADARIAYNAGHATAIQKAIHGDLEGAYAMNAFADHFLEDCFSAGHLRTPRRFLHRSLDLFADLCAKLMHDEDNAIGLSVKNPRGQTWTMYGDKRALDAVDDPNKELCVDAVQASADEIYKAYQTKQAPSPADYQAWTYAPTLESARGQQTLAPLFTFDGMRREDIKKRRLWKFMVHNFFVKTWLDCTRSGLWKYPIVLDVAQSVIPWSSIATTSVDRSRTLVFYQAPGGGVLQQEQRAGLWTGGPGSAPIFEAALFTPLATITFNDGKEVRVYYLDEKRVLQEFCYSADKGSWFHGSLGEMDIQAASNTSIAAIQYEDQGRLIIRVYCQESSHDNISEFVFDGNWERGALLPVALKGSSLAVATYTLEGRRIRLYYQTDDLAIKEHCFDADYWTPSNFDGGKAPGCVPINAVGYLSNDYRQSLCVFWSNAQNEIVGRTLQDTWGPLETIFGTLKSGTRFAVLQRDKGKDMKIYYQTADDSVQEISNDGDAWNGESKVVPVDQISDERLLTASG